MKKIFFILVFMVSVVFANEWEIAKVKYVSDGDTLWLQKGNEKPFKVRLVGIDTFETKVNHRVFMQLETLKKLHYKSKNTVKKVLYFGFKAKDYVTKRYLHKTVKYHSYGKDKYGRELVWIDTLNFSLVRQGLAVYYPNNLIDKGRKAYLLELSKDANLHKRGIYARY
jgi:endonuclease YncB( thermonuclease family)